MPKLSRRRHKAPQPEGGSGESDRAGHEASDDAGPTPAIPPDGGPSVDFTQLGAQVATVLASAKEAAEKMMLEADVEARRIRTASEKEAGEALETAKAAAERADAEAASVRADAERQSKRVREEADLYAMATRQAADAKAGATLARAETQAVAQDGKLRERQRMLVEGVVRTEERLTQLAEGLHELAGSLEELVAPRDQETSDTGSLVDILNRSASESHLPTASESHLPAREDGAT